MTKIIPFLKWAGGKRWFINRYSHLLPRSFNNYIEPFLGGGSVYFYLQPERAILGDLNEELIITYQAIKENWEEVEKLLHVHQELHNDEYYYKMRESIPVNKFERAARLIYLNRTCFNGIYRVNAKGKFNVPKGTRDSVVFETDNFEMVSKLLSSAELWVSDFEPLISEAKCGDFVFADPPYTVSHNQNGFIKYNENIFSWNDQIRLADILYKARLKGVKIVSTNANHQSIRSIYQERGFVVKTVSRYSSISANPNRRNKFEEIVILANV